MSDLISRQAAIRWIKAECNPYGKPTLDYETSCRIMEHLERMPSAEPETASNGSITCVKSEKMHDRTMGDLISRQDAIKAVEEERFPVDSDYAEGFMAALDKVGWILKEWLPSAEKAQLPEEDATSVCKCPCVYREPCDVCHYDGHLGMGCPAERRGE